MARALSVLFFILSEVEHAANSLHGANRDGVFAPAGHMCVGVSIAVQDGLLHLEQTAASNVSQTHFFMICPVAAHASVRDTHTPTL